MPDDKNTLPFWRWRRPNFLSLERAIASPEQTARDSDAEQVVIDLMAARRRFEEAKGKVKTG
jgi:hypothetical protein